MVERIVVFAPNWLGDAVMALPAIADVRRAYPEVTLAVAARAGVAPLFDVVHGVNETPVIGSRSSHAAVAGDVAILLPNSFNAALTAYRARIPERWGYRADWRAPLLTRAVPRPGPVHQVAYYQHLVAALGIANGPAQPRVEVTADHTERGRAVLRGAGWDGTTPVVALAAGAAYGTAKRWPPELFGRLARRFAADGIACVLVGSKADAPTGRRVVAAAGSSTVIDLIGRTSLAELAGVFSASRAVVSNDSGAMHLAAAVGVPLTAIFGPTDESATAPIGSRRIDTGAPAAPADSDAPGPAAGTVIVHPVWCRPCMLRECPLDHACMRGIPVDAVYRAAAAGAR